MSCCYRLEGTNPAKYVQTVISSVYQSIVDNKLYVGEWGDANYTNTNEWLKVRGRGALEVTTWQSGGQEVEA